VLIVCLLQGCSLGSSATADYRSQLNAICRARGEDTLKRFSEVEAPSDLRARHDRFVRAAHDIVLLSGRVQASTSALQAAIRQRDWRTAEIRSTRLTKAENQALAATERFDALAKELGLKDCVGVKTRSP
jgi:hypothetical protein